MACYNYEQSRQDLRLQRALVKAFSGIGTPRVLYGGSDMMGCVDEHGSVIFAEVDIDGCVYDVAYGEGASSGKECVLSLLVFDKDEAEHYYNTATKIVAWSTDYLD